MSSIKLDIDKQLKIIKERYEELPRALEKASMRALTKTVTWLKGRASKEISQKTRIQLKVIRNRMIILKDFKRVLRRELRINRLGVPAIKAGRAFQTKTGVQVGKHFFKSAFIATMKNKHKGVFQRVDKERLPIEEKRIMIDRDAYEILENLLENEIPKQFEKYFDHEFEYIMSKK